MITHHEFASQYGFLERGANVKPAKLISRKTVVLNRYSLRAVEEHDEKWSLPFIKWNISFGFGATAILRERVNNRQFHRWWFKFQWDFCHERDIELVSTVSEQIRQWSNLWTESWSIHTKFSQGEDWLGNKEKGVALYILTMFVHKIIHCIQLIAWMPLPQTSAGIFSIPFSVHFLRCWWSEFVSLILMTLITVCLRGDTATRN